MSIRTKNLSIKENMLWNMLGSAIGLGCQWAVTIIVVRLAPDLTTAGLYSLAISVYGIFSPIAQFGMHTYLITDASKRNSAGDYITLAFGTSLLASILTTGYALLTCRPNSWTVIAAYCAYKGIAAVIDILHAVDQKECRMDYVGVSLALQGSVCLAAFTLSYFLTSNLTLSILLMALCTLAIGVLYDLPRVKFLTPLKLGIQRNKAVRILSACLLIVVANVANGAYSSLPRQVLSSQLGDASLGIYASIATPVAIIQVGSTYIYNPLIGYFAETYHSKDKQGFIKLTLSTACGIALIGIAAFAGAELLAYPVLNLLYGADVAAHADLMSALILSSILLGVAGFLNNLLVAVRSLRIMVLGSFAALLVVAFGSPIFINAFGMNGATFALMAGCLISILISLCGIIWQTKLQFKN